MRVSEIKILHLRYTCKYIKTKTGMSLQKLKTLKIAQRYTERLFEFYYKDNYLVNQFTGSCQSFKGKQSQNIFFQSIFKINNLN